jgi:uncharacterized membrane protein YgdD (TMEM256/DUF423 family)
VSGGFLGAFGSHRFDIACHSSAIDKGDLMLGIAAAVLLFIAFLINAGDVSTNHVFTSTNVMLIGLALLALHLSGVGGGWATRRRR